MVFGLDLFIDGVLDLFTPEPAMIVLMTARRRNSAMAAINISIPI